MADLSSDSDDPDPPPALDALRIQILATEHWGLLATRSMAWNEMFTRAGMFVTVLSASIVSLALVAQAMGFDDRFLLFASLVLAVTLLLGISTLIRLSDALQEDIWLVQGMNRLRNAYLHAAPDIEPWFSLGHHDDLTGILLSVGPERTLGGVRRRLSSIATTVGVINCLLAGVILSLLTDLLVHNTIAATVMGIVGTLIAGMYVLFILPMREIRRGTAMLNPRFPSPPLPPN